MKEIYWLADNDPVKIEKYLNIPIWEYWQILNERTAILQKQIEKTKKK